MDRTHLFAPHHFKIKNHSTMRCTNCGWNNNPDGLTKCEKCSAPLTGAPPASAKPVAPQAPPLQRATEDISASTGGAATIMGQRPNTPAWDAGATPPSTPSPAQRENSDQALVGGRKAQTEPMGRDKNQNILTCPNCGYMNAANTAECARCETSLLRTPVVEGKTPREKEKGAADPDVKKPQRRIEKSSQDPTLIVPNAGATMNPWSKPKTNGFHLKPVSREGENLNISLDFNGLSHELNRSNLEPNNLTITSKVQAVIEYRDGGWFVANKSSMQTTFIRVDGEVKLEKGDILLFGDRMFEFDC